MLACATNSTFATNFLNLLPSKLEVSENVSQMSLNPRQVPFPTDADIEVYAER